MNEMPILPCPNADNLSTTKPVIHKTSLLWTIENFSRLPEKVEQSVESSVFFADSDNKTKWSLNIHPNGYKEEDKEFISLYIYMKESDRETITANYELAIIDDNQHIFRKYDSKQSFKKTNGWGVPKFISRSELNTRKSLLLPNNKLTIYCEINYFDKYETTNALKTDLKRKRKTLTDYMEVILQNSSGCDVEIVVRGHKFNAHKLILTARSPVFAAMFEHPMKESQQNRVDINDIDKEVFAKLLHFIYTDKVCNEDIDSNMSLFSAADKYNLEDLKSICEEYITSQMSVETVSDILILADNHSAQELKKKAIDFIKSNSFQVMKTKGWIRVIQKPSLLDLI